MSSVRSGQCLDNPPCFSLYFRKSSNTLSAMGKSVHCVRWLYDGVTMQTRVLLIAGSLLWLAASPVYADIYKCIGEGGRITYSNVTKRGCTRLHLDPLPTVSSTPSSFPRVENDAQKARDNDRRRILEGELAAEQQSLDEAKQALAAQEAIRNGNERNYQKVLDRIQPFKDKVSQHERNIESIESELKRVR